MDIRNWSWVAIVALVICLGALIFFGLAYADCGQCGTKAHAEKKAECKAQTLCPVLGEPINKEFFVDVEGYRVYLCCQACANAVKADPKKYIEKMKASGVQPEKCPAQCPSEKKKDK